MNLIAAAVMPLAPLNQARPRAVMEKENSGPESLNRREERRWRPGSLFFRFDFMAVARCQLART